MTHLMILMELAHLRPDLDFSSCCLDPSPETILNFIVGLEREKELVPDPNRSLLGMMRRVQRLRPLDLPKRPLPINWETMTDQTHIGAPDAELVKQVVRSSFIKTSEYQSGNTSYTCFQTMAMMFVFIGRLSRYLNYQVPLVSPGRHQVVLVVLYAIDVDRMHSLKDCQPSPEVQSLSVIPSAATSNAIMNDEHTTNRPGGSDNAKSKGDTGYYDVNASGFDHDHKPEPSYDERRVKSKETDASDLNNDKSHPSNKRRRGV
ncbi:hypothetical protein PT974_10005 [Cladobotryum mycophilum]|uniref:Uncharacterized protein n=1 Tax=Cladobotryum mycophilum TaxID=491253 RepID=A0ABR0S8M5_9HYPO